MDFISSGECIGLPEERDYYGEKDVLAYGEIL